MFGQFSGLHVFRRRLLWIFRQVFTSVAFGDFCWLDVFNESSITTTIFWRGFFDDNILALAIHTNLTASAVSVCVTSIAVAGRQAQILLAREVFINFCALGVLLTILCDVAKAFVAKSFLGTQMGAVRGFCTFFGAIFLIRLVGDLDTNIRRITIFFRFAFLQVFSAAGQNNDSKK
ncbi:hypothetical protein KKH43_01365 [Patescibacteria group bacterium]|nr:hypothetical protein [Patescibacteria group bacterium]